MSDRFENFTYIIEKLSKLIQKIKNHEVKKYNLKAVHVMCIYHLSQSRAGLTNKQLVNLTLEDKAAISRALLFMKNNNIINYEQNKYNASITLTEYGYEIAKYIQLKTVTALDAASEGVTDEDRIVLYKALEAIQANVENYYDKLTNGE